jgi:hypothetical protein
MGSTTTPALSIHWEAPELHSNTAMIITQDVRNQRLGMYLCV